MALTQNQLQHVCMLNGSGQQCRYLDEDVDDNGNYVYVCKKLVNSDRKIIDDEINEFLDDMKRSGQDPMTQGVPLGDNCSGYIKLTTKKQGYDLDKP